MAKAFEVFMSDNCKLTSRCELPSEDYLQRPGVFYDQRVNMLIENINLTNMKWYENYLETMASLAGKNPDAYPTYMLDLGYIPIVYVPSCCAKLSVPMRTILDAKGIPHVKTNPMSFIFKYCSFDTIDVWMSKLDINKLFNIPIAEIKSVDVVRRLFAWEEVMALMN